MGLCVFDIFDIRLLKWPLGRFWRTMAQITRSDARMCLFTGSNFPKPLEKGGVVRQSQPIRRKMKISIS